MHRDPEALGDRRGQLGRAPIARLLLLADLDADQLAEACFAFLPARAELDLLGYEDPDIFAH